MSEYSGPERRMGMAISPADVLQLTEQVRTLNGRVARMATAIETVGQVAERQGQLEEEQQRLERETMSRDEIEARLHVRRTKIIAWALAGAMVVIAAVVAIGALIYITRREHRDFVALRNASVASCQVRNAQAENSIEFYRSLGKILIDAEAKKPSPATQEAVNAFVRASTTVPPPVDCNNIAQVGR